MSEPTPKTTRGDLELIGLLRPFVEPWRRWIYGALALTPVGVLAGLIQPLLLKEAIDAHIKTGEMEGMRVLGLLFVAVVAVAFTAKALASYALQRVGLEGLTALRLHVFRHVMGQGQRYFDKRTTGSLMTRTINDLEAVYESLIFGVVNLLSDLLMIIGILVAMAVLDWRLTLVVLALGPAVAVVVDVFRRRLRALSIVIRRSLSRLNGFFAEQIYGMTTVQLYEVKDHARREFRRRSYKYLDAYRKSNWWDAGLYAIMDGMSALAIGAMLWYGAVRFEAPESVITIGLLVAFIDYLGMLFGPIREFSGRIATVQRAVGALERVAVLLESSDRVGEGHVAVSDSPGHVTLRDVGFAYGEGKPKVLDGVSFDLAPGEVVALVGGTGSGKTTIARLLSRTYDGYSGSIRLDGHELQDVRVQDLKRQVAMVQQDVYLFEATVRENIALWSADVDDEDVYRAAGLARVDSFIQSLAGGFDHVVRERGANLSGGQRQLLAIARAMARRSPVVILDEATASVDPVTETLVDEAVAELFARRTVLVIAHRLTTILRADRVLVLHQGRVVEEGSHGDLLARGGYYSTLVEAGCVA